MTKLGFIHQFVNGKSARTLLLLHGTGGNEEDLLDLGRAIDADASLLSPRGKILENGAPRFFRRLAEGVFDEEDVVLRAKELAKFIDDAADEYKIDIDHLIAVGYSNGANIAAAMLLLGVARFSAAILFRAMVPLSNIAIPSLAGKRVLMCNGHLDPIIPLAKAERLGQLFESVGAAIDLEVLPSGHGLTPRDVAAAREWLAR